MARHIDDVRRIVAVCALWGIAVGEREAYEAWTDYSERSAAGWLSMDCSDDALFSIVEDRLPSRPSPT